MALKKRRIKYHMLDPGEPRELPIGASRMAACCDCGLVHRHDFSLEKGKIVERVYRDQRATAQIRGRMARDGEIIAEPGSNVYVILLRIRANQRPKALRVKYAPE